MAEHVAILRGKSGREHAKRLIDSAPDGSVCRVTAPRRTLPQNAMLHAMLSEISMLKPGGRVATPDVWKALFMNAAGYSVQFEAGLDGRPFPIGFRSSKMTKDEFSMLIEWINAWCAEQGIVLRNWQKEAA